MSKYFIGLAHFAIRSIYFHFINFQFITVRFQIPLLRPKPSTSHIGHRESRIQNRGSFEEGSVRFGSRASRVEYQWTDRSSGNGHGPGQKGNQMMRDRAGRLRSLAALPSSSSSSTSSSTSTDLPLSIWHILCCDNRSESVTSEPLVAFQPHDRESIDLSWKIPEYR